MYTQSPVDYFGQRNPALGKIQHWDNYPSYNFPYELHCEECGWLINYSEVKVVIAGGFNGKNHYHKECWDIKHAENRTKPKWNATYGFRETEVRNGTYKQTDADWVWSSEHTRFEKQCKTCKRMMCVFTRESREGRTTSGGNYRYNKYRDICGHCKRKEIDAARRLEIKNCHCSEGYHTYGGDHQ